MRSFREFELLAATSIHAWKLRFGVGIFPCTIDFEKNSIPLHLRLL